MSTPFPPWTVSDQTIQTIQTIQVSLGLLGSEALDTAQGRARGDLRGFPQTVISSIIQTVRGDQITSDPTPSGIVSLVTDSLRDSFKCNNRFSFT
jgi:hypothetical protein